MADVTEEVQKLANDIVDNAESLANHAYDLGQEAAQDVVSLVANAVRALTATLESLAGIAVGKKEE